MTVPTSVFYALEATIALGFTDPIGPADVGYLSTPMLALCAVEAAPSTTSTLRASDTGYRTLATDSGGVQAYPPTIVTGLSVDTALNLDPTKSAVAASWGTLVLNNTDHAYDTIAATWQNEGQPITVYRGSKTWDATRNLWLDPAYATLQAVFVGIMAKWRVLASTIEITLRDASYFLEQSVPRTLYGGTGGTDGIAALAGTSRPLLLGGQSVGGGALRLTPTLVDTANLIYQFADGAAGLGGVYDGGVALTLDGAVASLYSGTPPAAGHVRYDAARGLFQLGSQPVYNVTADGYNLIGSSSSAAELVYYALSNAAYFALPASFLSAAGSALTIIGVNSGLAGNAAGLPSALYLATNDDIDGITLLERLLSATTAVLVPGRDGKLRLLLLAPIPSNTASVQTFDDTTNVSITAQPLPTSIDPTPYRMRLAYQRNFTVQTTGLAGAVSPDTAAFLALAYRTVTGVATPSQFGSAKTSDPPVIGTDGAACNANPLASQLLVNALVGLWGTRRRLYEIEVPQSVGATLDWASVVTVVSDFDGLQAPGKQGQIVGWAWKADAATTTFRVLV
jgi:hypothetical protein